MQYIRFMLLLCLYLCTFNLQAQEVKISRSYVRTPLSEVLRDISEASEGKRIAFIYDQLEDYTVTCTFRNLTAIEAVSHAVGLYPIRIAQTEESITVEPLRDFDKKLIGNLINEHGEPVEFASIRLYNPVDSTFFTSGASNENGDFVIPTDAANVRMEISCLGHVQQSKNVSVGNIGTIIVYTNPILLDAVTVSADDFMLVDGHIETRPSKKQVEHSFNIFSLLNMQPFPGLIVNEFNNSINAYGSSVIVLVNGIERSYDYLQSIQPKNVAKIAYYSAVPPKYLNRNVGAVIDIILKEPKEGGSFYTDSQGCTKNANAFAGGTYNQGKSEIALQYKFTYANSHDISYKLDRKFFGDNFTIEAQENALESIRDISNKLNLDYTFRPDSTSALILSTYLKTFNKRNLTDGEVTDSFNDDYHSQSVLKNHQLRMGASAFYQKNWDGGKQIEATVAASFSPKEDYSRTLSDSIYDSGMVSIYNSHIETNHKSVAATLFYNLPLNEHNHLAFKVSNSYNYTHSNYLFENFIAINKDNKTDVDGNWSSKIGKAQLMVQAGMQLRSIENNSQKWTKAFLTSFLSFGVPLGNGFDFSTYASFSAIAPGLSLLIENKQVYDRYYYVTGNPDLKTANLLYLKQRLWWSKKYFWMNLTLTESKYYNPSYSDIRYAGNGEFVCRPYNAKSSLSISPSFQFGFTNLLDGRFSANVLLKYYFDHARLANGSVNKHHGFEYNISLYGYFGKWTVHAGLSKPAKRLDIIQIWQNQRHTMLSIRYRVNIQLHLGVSGLYLFAKNGAQINREYLYTANPINVNLSIDDFKNVIMFNLRYDVNFGRIFGKVKRNSSAETGSPDVKFVK